MSETETIGTGDVAAVSKVIDQEGNRLPAKVSPGTLAAVTHWLLNGEVVPLPTEDDAGQGIIDRIMAADNLAAVFEGSETTKSDDVLGHRLQVRGVTFHEGDAGDEPGIFAVLDATDQDTGIVNPVSVGGRSVIAQLVKLSELGAWPMFLRIVKTAKPTKAGYHPKQLELA